MVVVLPPAPKAATPPKPTRSLRDQPTRAAFRTKVVDLLTPAIGYVEGKGNDTPFGEWLGINRKPWCVELAAFMFAAAAEAVGCENPLAGIQTKRGPAGATELYRYAAKKLWVLAEDEDPLPADLAIWDHDEHDGGPGHLGTVVAVRRTPKGLEVVTIEGNTSRSRTATQAQARNGGEIARHVHTRRGAGKPGHGRFLGYARFTRRFGR